MDLVLWVLLLVNSTLPLLVLLCLLCARDTAYTRGLTFAAGSAAAALQAGVGDVVGGSAIATMQSAAMGGYGLAFVNGVVQGGSIVVATAAGLLGVGGGGGGTGSQ